MHKGEEGNKAEMGGGTTQGIRIRGLLTLWISLRSSSVSLYMANWSSFLMIELASITVLQRGECSRKAYSHCLVRQHPRTNGAGSRLCPSII